MNILLIGSGGREHALAWKISQSPRVTKLYCAPGNPGIAELAECVDIAADNIPALKDFALQNKIDLTVAGPEVPLTLGIVDEFELAGLKVFGPSKAAAQLEGSKMYAKKIMKKYKIPTAAYAVFTDAQKALEHVYMSRFPVVIKADGLAAGKGVTVAVSLVEAKRAIHAALRDKVFGEAGAQIIIEEFLSGEEASLLAFCDGKDFVPMVSAQDHKAVYDEDKGPNTGGMGAYSPAPAVTKEILRQVGETIFKPLLDGMAKEGAPYKGVLYAGLMLTPGGPKVVEFNCRFGDPETQAVLPRLQTDIVDIFEACLGGQISAQKISWSDAAAVCVVLAADGYPGQYAKGKEISGIAAAAALPDTCVFHAGTAKQDGRLVTSGGRVLGVTALGADIPAAIKNAYKAAGLISFPGLHKRKDIGKKALAYLP
ncbi:phosphoribosylamine--glycine ligase [Candidatus Termititenax persephonae]|uniref:Phosphoribosylamine--glycine ligase n=1 Tax=Candidatus Termititenax persephonae TaxID=2218525 RepID=A0A388THI2_9BACT|nr:phosphoribosylamine--glycine ligase [Candidatus Termititenax persephonae]